MQRGSNPRRQPETKAKVQTGLVQVRQAEVKSGNVEINEVRNRWVSLDDWNKHLTDCESESGGLWFKAGVNKNKIVTVPEDADEAATEFSLHI